MQSSVVSRKVLDSPRPHATPPSSTCLQLCFALAWIVVAPPGHLAASVTVCCYWCWFSRSLRKAWIVVAPPGNQSGHPSAAPDRPGLESRRPPERTRHPRCYVIDHAGWTHAALISPSGLASYFSAWYRSRRLSSCSIDLAVWPCVILLSWLLAPPSGLVAVLISPYGLAPRFSVIHSSRRLASCSIDLAVWPHVLLIS